MISLTSPVETWAHRWPAGPKLLGLCLATVGLFALQGVVAQGVALLGVAVLYAAGGAVFLRSGMRRLWPLWPFVVLIGLWHLAIGDPQTGAVIACRMIAAVGLANLVTMTTKLSDMMGVLHKMLTPLRPLGLNSRPIELAVAMVIRFTPVLSQKAQALVQAWRARSRRKPGWRVILPFLVLALDDAEHVSDALRARGGL
ncbi:ABC transporter permease [Sulfitobacter sp. SK012]|uniref:energy-coupling factor transporter transmembrane component T family protein n=1 Tax=Sulfitobacter sp. SK012 TaxID=1389005 RepID=UPI000E0B0BE0|nr:energy-coupling factor transporter transmembrane protein EcfT [Sulfitobacter sp. SK012]AXI44975.1 ABC transporter permease [Sulfitobacter sp. SK012]